jgi:hypothetical protein
MKKQPCQFGRVAASREQIFFCVLRWRDLAEGDVHVRDKIHRAKLLWKQRALAEPDSAQHSFLLLCATPELTVAAPDDALKRFAERLLALSGWAPARRAKHRENPITSDYLYLRNPDDDKFYGFQFNIDFFAAAGDRRWWHDHRVPGGITFTANSTGHMKAFLEWYRERGTDHGDWAVTQAMMTIARSHPMKEGGQPGTREGGCVTWLRDLDDRGRPLVPGLLSPLKKPPKQLQGKDWTRYEGLIHTDHAIREEFFADREEPITRAAPYREDLTYLYDRTQADFINFTAGKRFAPEEVYAEIGSPDTWTHRAGEGAPPEERTPEQTEEVALLLHQCCEWAVDED